MRPYRRLVGVGGVIFAVLSWFVVFGAMLSPGLETWQFISACIFELLMGALIGASVYTIVMDGWVWDARKAGRPMPRPNALDWLSLGFTSFLVFASVLLDYTFLAAVWGVVLGGRIADILHWRAKRRQIQTSV